MIKYTTTFWLPIYYEMVQWYGSNSDSMSVRGSNRN